ncbi:hypothetical protein ES703_74790 [subsurface metagenome]
MKTYAVENSIHQNSQSGKIAYVFQKSEDDIEDQNCWQHDPYGDKNSSGQKAKGFEIASSRSTD